MTRVTLEINEKTEYGKALLQLIYATAMEHKEVDVVKIPNKATLASFDEIRKGKVTKVNSIEELFKELNS